MAQATEISSMDKFIATSELLEALGYSMENFTVDEVFTIARGIKQIVSDLKK